MMMMMMTMTMMMTVMMMMMMMMMMTMMMLLMLAMTMLLLLSQLSAPSLARLLHGLRCPRLLIMVRLAEGTRQIRKNGNENIN